MMEELAKIEVKTIFSIQCSPLHHGKSKGMTSIHVHTLYRTCLLPRARLAACSLWTKSNPEDKVLSAFSSTWRYEYIHHTHIHGIYTNLTRSLVYCLPKHLENPRQLLDLYTYLYIVNTCRYVQSNLIGMYRYKAILEYFQE